jgi:hypothetical protein
MITLADIQAKVDPAILSTHDTQAITDAFNLGRTAIKDYWLTDRGLVSDLVAATGSTVMSDSILTKLDGLAASSRSTRAMMNRLENDLRGVNFGDAALRAQFEYLGSAGVFTAQEVAALLALAYMPDPVSTYDITVCVQDDQGIWRI